jgi:hypothetical protein
MNNSIDLNPKDVAFSLSNSIPQDDGFANLINEKIVAKDDGFLFRLYLLIKKETIDLSQYPESIREVYATVLNKLHKKFDK